MKSSSPFTPWRTYEEHRDLPSTYAKAEKPGYDLLKADEVFCEVIRKWVAAGVKLLKDADVGVYIDTVDTGQLVTAHLTSKPEDRVKTPCAENCPTVLGDRSTDDEALWEAHKRRQIEKERTLRQAESSAAPAHAGEQDDAPTTPTAPAPAAPVGGGGSGGGGGGDSLKSQDGTPKATAVACRSRRQRRLRPTYGGRRQRPSARRPPLPRR